MNSQPPNSFKFFIPLIKAYERDGKKYVGGIASDTGLDKDQEKMSPEAIKKMAEYGTQRSLELLASHQADWEGSLGEVTKLEVVGQASSLSLHFEAELEDENPLAERLYKKLIRGKQYGVSIGGRVLEAEYQYDHEAKRQIRVFKDIELDHIAVTRKPANPRTWLSAIAKAWENYQKSEESVGAGFTTADIDIVKAEWTTTYINSLDDSCFAVIEPAYERGETKDKRCRHLPHHNKEGKIDLPHLSNALARMNQVKPVTDSISTEELRAKAKKHLIAHAKEYLPHSQWAQEEEKTMDDGRQMTKEIEQVSRLLKEHQELLKAKEKEIETLNKRIQELEALPLPQKGLHPQVFAIAKDFVWGDQEAQKIQKELDNLLEQALKEPDPRKREQLIEKRFRLREKLRWR